MGLDCPAQFTEAWVSPMLVSGWGSVIEISEKGGKHNRRCVELGLYSVSLPSSSSSSSSSLNRDCSVREKEERDRKWRWLSTSSEGRS